MKGELASGINEEGAGEMMPLTCTVSSEKSLHGNGWPVWSTAVTLNWTVKGDPATLHEVEGGRPLDDVGHAVTAERRPSLPHHGCSPTPRHSGADRPGSAGRW